MFTVTKVTICLITFFVFSRIALWFQKRLKKSMVILVDINALFDIMPIYQRGLVYVENRPNSTLIEYINILLIISNYQCQNLFRHYFQMFRHTVLLRFLLFRLAH